MEFIAKPHFPIKSIVKVMQNHSSSIGQSMSSEEIIGLSSDSEPETPIKRTKETSPSVPSPVKREVFQLYFHRKLPASSDLTQYLKTSLSEKAASFVDSAVYTNTTAKCTTGCKFPNLADLAPLVPNSSFNSRKMNALGLLIVNPFAVVRVFPNGCCTSIGANSELASKIALRKAVRKLRLAGKPVEFADFRLTSLSCVVQLSNPCRNLLVKALVARPGEFLRDEEQTLGYVWVSSDFRATVKVFTKSSKVLVVGSKSPTELSRILEKLCSYLTPNN